MSRQRPVASIEMHSLDYATPQPRRRSVYMRFAWFLLAWSIGITVTSLIADIVWARLGYSNRKYLDWATVAFYLTVLASGMITFRRESSRDCLGFATVGTFLSFVGSGLLHNAGATALEIMNR